MSVEIKKLGHGLMSFIELIRIFEDVFEMENFKMPEDEYLQKILAEDNFSVFVAVKDEKVVGGLTAYLLKQYYAERPLLYVYDLAVKTEHQRQGIGRLLISAVTEYSKEIGAEEMYVQAEEIDQHAVTFYHSTGAVASKFINFSYSFRHSI
ncbi:Acetyltransferase (GNAT) family protein [Olivibacter domesticus]|uniref:Acetyltransferase (GNAT) family protein n=1 Tax=Olivibacter domesticus TaxID=407022 RepID=A0A1H7R0X7_OLID1|nr:Acetyltransferase (GNAT) family protein [Olivibacter domesticus]